MTTRRSAGSWAIIAIVHSVAACATSSGPRQTLDPAARGSEASIEAYACADLSDAAALDAELDAVIGAYELRGRAEAEAELEIVAARHPTSSRPLVLRARIAAYEGDEEWALRALDERLCGGPRDLPALYFLARLHEDRASRGPNVRHERGRIVATPSRGEDEGAYVSRERRAATEALRRLVAIAPEDVSAWALLGESLRNEDRLDEALEAFETCLRSDPSAATCAVGAGRTLLQMERSDEAVAVLQAAASIAPRNVIASEALARALKAAGHAQEATAEARRGQFLAYMPSFFWFEPSDSDLSAVEALASHRSGVGGAAEALVESLAHERSERSSLLLAAFVFHHSHDELERRAFDALIERQAFPQVQLLLERGQSACTIRRAAGALGAAGRVEAFDALIARLRDDVMPFHPMGIPEALAALGDPRAATWLAKVAASPAPPGLDSLLELAHTMRRGRAALALARFSASREVDDALGIASSDPDLYVSLRARAALAIRDRLPAQVDDVCQVLVEKGERHPEVTEAFDAAGLRCTP